MNTITALQHVFTGRREFQTVAQSTQIDGDIRYKIEQMVRMDRFVTVLDRARFLEKGNRYPAFDENTKLGSAVPPMVFRSFPVGNKNQWAISIIVGPRSDWASGREGNFLAHTYVFDDSSLKSVQYNLPFLAFYLKPDCSFLTGNDSQIKMLAPLEMNYINSKIQYDFLRVATKVISKEKFQLVLKKFLESLGRGAPCVISLPPPPECDAGKQILSEEFSKEDALHHDEWTILETAGLYAALPISLRRRAGFLVNVLGVPAKRPELTVLCSWNPETPKIQDTVVELNRYDCFPALISHLAAVDIGKKDRAVDKINKLFENIEELLSKYSYAGINAATELFELDARTNPQAPNTLDRATMMINDITVLTNMIPECIEELPYNNVGTVLEKAPNILGLGLENNVQSDRIENFFKAILPTILPKGCEQSNSNVSNSKMHETSNSPKQFHEQLYSWEVVDRPINALPTCQKEIIEKILDLFIGWPVDSRNKLSIFKGLPVERQIAWLKIMKWHNTSNATRKDQCAVNNTPEPIVPSPSSTSLDRLSLLYSMSNIVSKRLLPAETATIIVSLVQELRVFLETIEANDIQSCEYFESFFDILDKISEPDSESFKETIIYFFGNSIVSDYYQDQDLLNMSSILKNLFNKKINNKSFIKKFSILCTSIYLSKRDNIETLYISQQFIKLIIYLYCDNNILLYKNFLEHLYNFITENKKCIIKIIKTAIPEFIETQLEFINALNNKIKTRTEEIRYFITITKVNKPSFSKFSNFNTAYDNKDNKDNKDKISFHDLFLSNFYDIILNKIKSDNDYEYESALTTISCYILKDEKDAFYIDVLEYYYDIIKQTDSKKIIQWLADEKTIMQYPHGLSSCALFAEILGVLYMRLEKAEKNMSPNDKQSKYEQFKTCHDMLTAKLAEGLANSTYNSQIRSSLKKWLVIFKFNKKACDKRISRKIQEPGACQSNCVTGNFIKAALFLRRRWKKSSRPPSNP